MTAPLDVIRALVTRTRLLGATGTQQLVFGLIHKQLNLTSVSELRDELGLPTVDANGLSQAYQRVVEALGDEAARGVVLGACAAPLAAEPELVWTSPGAPAVARRTAQVAVEVVLDARRTVVVVGYSLTEAAGPFIDALAAAARRGVTCSIVADRMEAKLSTLTARWPKDLGLPVLWTRPADPLDEQSALHAKFIVTDARRLLITSANLTYHGFHGNIEMGVLLNGSVGAKAEELIREWSKLGLIRRVGVAV